MPKVPVDYSKTCIYKLVHNDDINDENIYIGHTTDIVKRRYQHKTACINPNDKRHKLKVYQFICENGGWDNWKMILVEKYPCNDVDEAKARERYWIKELQVTLNSYEPCRTKKERYQDNKEQLLEQKKEYYKNNKQQIAEKHKEWYENNKEKIAEKSKEWREKNKEKIAEKRKEKITCECGCLLRKDTLNRHRKLRQHQAYLKKISL